MDNLRRFVCQCCHSNFFAILSSLTNVLNTGHVGGANVKELTLNNVILGAIAPAALLLMTSPVLANIWLKTGGVAKTPAGHYNYCQRGGRHCGGQKAYAPIQMTSKMWSKLNRVNAQVNRAIKPATDMQTRGVEEYWEIPKNRGDCEDYSLLKRSKLLRAGFKPSQLSLAKARLRNGEAHVVLVARTNEGDFALDNLTNIVRLASRTGHKFLSMQSATNASQWLTIRGFSKKPLSK
jgi:predicted transglutaminase-like cysteine proteinase